MILFFLLRQLADSVDHDFNFQAQDSSIKQVSVAGDFNSWNKDANPLKLGQDGRTWTTHLKLPYGKIQYKFVLNGSNWVLDPSTSSASDGNGNTNSVLLILPPDYNMAASPNDGIIAASALRHTMAEPDLNYDRGQLRFLLRARPDDLARVDLQVNGRTVPMNELAHGNIFETYEAFLPWDRKSDLSYDFVLHDGSRTAFYGPSGLENSQATKFKLSASSYKPFEVPAWVEKSVIYQIFPDRFADGDKSNDPSNVQPWGAQPTYYNFFGGDTAGVQEHLGYLSSLGVGAVYFNPVFESPSNHRYDTIDYLTIDPKFGTDQEFDDLTKAMQSRGIRTVMDFAFNHTAPDFFAFKDIRDKGQASTYTNWYFIKSYPVVVKENPPYVAWYNYPSMPKLNVMNPATHQYILDAVDFWKKNAALSGVRLDVANEVNPQMWRDLRAHVKSYAPDTWIVGEEWGDASPWLGGDQWDSTMGYQFRDAALHFFAERSTKPSEYMNRLMEVYASYPPQVSRNLMNLLDSHDTERFLNSCKGNQDLQLLAATVEFTWPGAPTMYYGDELGMQGGPDPDNRRCMDWSLANASNPTLAYYKRLIDIRNQTPVLQSGDPAILFTDDADRTFAYSRTLGQSCAVVVVNASDQPRKVSVRLPASLSAAAHRGNLQDVLSGHSIPIANETVVLDLPPLKAAVLIPAISPR
jgi:cyclomaltodextrinase